MLRFLVGFLIYLPSLYCLNDSVIAISPNDFVKLETIVNGTRRKLVLRYGFHRTSECLDFEKAYLCIQKCLDLKYDIAHADKNCYCTCYVKKDKAKYMDKSEMQEKWKLGAPTTKIPIWAQKKKEKMEETLEDDHIELDEFNGNGTFLGNHTAVDKVGNETEVLDLAVGNNSTVIPVSNSSESVGVNVTTVDAAAITTVVA